MQKQETLSYEEQFADQSVGFSPYTLWSTGIVPAQTLLKVDSYSLACVPFQFSMRKAVLMGALSQDEIAFFQRYKGALAGLALSFQKAQDRTPIKVFCRCQVDTIGMWKGREGVGLFAFSWKPIPPDLIQILGEYHLSIERLRLQYDDLKGRSIQIGPEAAKKLGYNNYAVMTLDGVQHKLAVFSLGAGQAEFLLPLKSPDLAEGGSFSLSLAFIRYRFALKGKILKAERLPSGVQKVKAGLEFSPELVELVSEYFFSNHR